MTAYTFTDILFVTFGAGIIGYVTAVVWHRYRSGGGVEGDTHD